MWRTNGTTLRSISTSSLVKRICTPALFPPACCEVRPGKTPTAVAPKLSKMVWMARKAFAISKQKNYRGNAPGHAEHGEHGLAHVVPHGGISLFEKIAFHAYSLRSASTGCKSAALRAGYKPATTPEKASDVMAKADVIGT